MKLSFKLTFELFKVLDILELNGINAIPFKGSVLGQLAHNDPLSRDFTDIDLLVSGSDYFKVYQVLKHHGYEMPSSPTLSTVQQEEHYRYFGEYVLVKQRSNICLDVHHRWLGGGDLLINIDFSHIWTRLEPVTIANREILTLSPSDTLIYLCMNGLKDGWNGTKTIVDISGIITHHPDLKWQDLLSEAHRLKIDRPIHLGLLLANHLNPDILPEWVNQELRSDQIAQRLSTKICRRMIHQDKKFLHLSLLNNFSLKLLALDNWNYRFQYLKSIPVRLFRLYIAVNDKDLEFLALPQSLHFLYPSHPCSV